MDGPHMGLLWPLSESGMVVLNFLKKVMPLLGNNLF